MVSPLWNFQLLGSLEVFFKKVFLLFVRNAQIAVSAPVKIILECVFYFFWSQALGLVFWSFGVLLGCRFTELRLLTHLGGVFNSGHFFRLCSIRVADYPHRFVVVVLFTCVIVIVFFILLLFSVFQNKKNKFIQDQEEAQKKFESEIAETQIEIREETLRNISWELHDNIGQSLTLAKIQLQNGSAENIEEVSEIITKSLNELRALSKLINPEFIKNIKLKEAIQLEIDRFNRLNFIESSLQVIGKEQSINEKTSIVIFRILQEFFSNTIKHSKATRLEVHLTYTKEELEIKAKDNGIGFHVEKIQEAGLGLKNIENRANLIGAEAKLISVPKEGTQLLINYKFKK